MRQLVGSLIYQTLTLPDLGYVLVVLAHGKAEEATQGSSSADSSRYSILGYLLSQRRRVASAWILWCRLCRRPRYTSFDKRLCLQLSRSGCLGVARKRESLLYALNTLSKMWQGSSMTNLSSWYVQFYSTTIRMDEDKLRLRMQWKKIV